MLKDGQEKQVETFAIGQLGGLRQVMTPLHASVSLSEK
jgi:hypothetical protein